MSALFARKRPTAVIHLAARVGGLFANMKANVEFLRDNFYMNDTIFEESRLAGVPSPDIQRYHDRATS